MLLNNKQEQLKLPYLEMITNKKHGVKHLKISGIPKGILMSMYVPAVRYSCSFRLQVEVKNILT